MKKTVLFLFRVLIFAFIFFLLNVFLDFRTSFESVDIYLGYPFLCLITLVFGPLCGALSGALGIFFASAAGGYFSWKICVMMSLNIGLVGQLCRNMDVKNGFFRKKEALYFIRIVFLVNFGTWLIFRLAAQLRGKGPVFFTAVPLSIPLTYCFSGMFLGTLLIAMYARSRLSALNFYRS